MPRSGEHEERPERKNAEGLKKHIYIYLYKAPLREWDVPRGVTQAGMPQGKMINRHPAVLLVA